MSTQKIVTHRPVKTRDTAPNLFGYRPYWAKRFGSAPFLPMTRAEMEHVGWDSCDIVLVSGDAYVDHPSFGAAVIGRVLEAQGFRVGIIAQPRWRQADDFLALGKPKLFFGVTAGNMDSMVNRYTADKRRRSDDAYSPDARADMRPDRCVLVYAHRCREAYKDVPIVLGGIEASLRRIAHFDYWSETIRRSVLVDAKADILVYGNGERQIVEIAHRIAKGEPINTLQNIRGTAVLRKTIPDGWTAAKTTRLTASDSDSVYPDPYASQSNTACASADGKLNQDERINTLRVSFDPVSTANHDRVYVRLPDYSIVKNDPVQYAQASRIFHIETNPGNARVIVQRHGSREVWINPPPLPLSTQELDQVFELPYTRKPHPSYQGRKIPAYEMIKYSVNIMRGCFGGCTFCSITEHEGRIIQSRSERSILREIETIRDEVPGFTGIISDLGGPTANMYRLACKSEAIEVACRRLSCVHPSICKNLNTDHQHLINLYQKARDLPGIKKILIASGLRYDLAIRSPKYVKELVTHHVGGYLKIAPEHTESGPLSVMMKPDMSSYDRFKKLFDKFLKEAGKEQYLIPYFIAAHPGTTDQDMLNLSLWLKQNGFRADQVQTFLPSPMAIATAMYHSGKNTLKKLKYESGNIPIPRGIKTRRLHKAFLRYHDAKNWPLLREALKKMGRSDLIGNGKKHLVPNWQPSSDMGRNTRKPTSKFATQHTGLPNFSDPQNRKSVKKRKRR